jgi:hypothetical protein
MHRSRRFLEHRKQTSRQRLQCGFLDLLKKFPHLLARRTVDARVRDRSFPVRRENDFALPDSQSSVP